MSELRDNVLQFYLNLLESESKESPILFCVYKVSEMRVYLKEFHAAFRANCTRQDLDEELEEVGHLESLGRVSKGRGRGKGRPTCFGCGGDHLIRNCPHQGPKGGPKGRRRGKAGKGRHRSASTSDEESYRRRRELDQWPNAPAQREGRRSRSPLERARPERGTDSRSWAEQMEDEEFP